MAYVFSTIKDAMGRDKQVKQDIFAPQQNPNQGGDASAMPQSQVKTSTEGEMTGSSGSGTAQSSEGLPGDTRANDQRVVKQNKMGVPDFTGAAQGALTKKNTELQNEANSYVATAKASGPKVEDAEIEGAISGDEAAGGKVRGLLSQDAATEAARYAGFDPKTDVNVADIEAMRTNEGTRGLLARNAGAKYNAGESAFDMMLLNRTPEFNQIRAQLLRDQEALTKTADELRGTKTEEARKAVQGNIATAQEGVKGSLGTKATALQKAQEEEMALENAALEALRKGGDKNFTVEQAKKVLADLKLKNQDADPYSDLGAKYLDLAAQGADASKYFTVRDNYTDYNDFIDEKEAARFNAINALLGKGDSWAAGDGPGARSTFNDVGYADALRSGATAANAKADVAAREQLDQLLATARTNQEKQLATARTLAAARAAAEYGGNYGVDASQFYRDVDPMAGLSAAEAAKMNALAQELGLGNAYKAGGGFGAGFDAGGYAEALAKAKMQADDAAEAQRQLEIDNTGGMGADESNPFTQLDARTPTAVDETFVPGVTGFKKVKGWCFPAGVRFRMADGSLKAIEDIAVGDEMSEGGTVTAIHTGQSDDVYLLGTALVTGDHPYFTDAGEWVLTKDADGAVPVSGVYRVFSVTNTHHEMRHEGGLLFGDFEADELFGLGG